MKPLIAHIDTTLTQLVQMLPQSLYPLMYGLSYIGKPMFTIGALVIIGLVGLFQHNARLVIAAVVAGSTFGFNSLLKVIFHRPRPDNYNAEDVMLQTFSFPSGHAASAVVIFGLLAYIAWKLLPQPWGAIVAGIITLVIIGIGVSRVYIGAHYPTDVIAGWIVGAIGLAIIIWIVRPL